MKKLKKNVVLNQRAPQPGASFAETVIELFGDGALSALQQGRQAGQAQPVALVLLLNDRLGRAMAEACGASAELIRGLLAANGERAFVISVVPRSQLILGLNAAGYNPARLAEATAKGGDVLALVGLGSVVCFRLPRPTASRRPESQGQPAFTGEIAVYEGGSDQLTALASKWEPATALALPALCKTPDGVIRLITEDMLAPPSVELAATAFLHLASWGCQAAVLTQRLAPGRTDDHGARLGRLRSLLGLPSANGCAHQ